MVVKELLGAAVTHSGPFRKRGSFLELEFLLPHFVELNLRLAESVSGFP